MFDYNEFQNVAINIIKRPFVFPFLYFNSKCRFSTYIVKGNILCQAIAPAYLITLYCNMELQSRCSHVGLCVHTG